MTKSDEELRRLILARRARFVAAAMGTSGVLVSCTEPSVCLSTPYTGDYTEATSSDTSPSVCLSPLTWGPPDTTGPSTSVCLSPTSGPPETSADAGADAGDGATGVTNQTSGTDTDGGSVDAGATTTSEVTTSGLTSEPTSEPGDTSTSVPTPCLSPPLITDLGLDTFDASAPDAGETPDASESP